MKLTLTLDDDVADALRKRAEIIGVDIDKAAIDVFSVWFQLTTPVERPKLDDPSDTEFRTEIDRLKYNQLNDEFIVEDFLRKAANSQ